MMIISYCVGDSGYGVDKHLLTPFKSTENRAQKRYNKAIKKTRCIIERSIVVWKSRFRSMDKSGWLICYSPAKVRLYIKLLYFVYTAY